jgi:hypothetical protein
MLKLPNVTLIALTSKDYETHGRALDISCKDIEFGAVKLICRPDIKNIDDWNRVIIYELWKYIDTEFAILIHADGYIISPKLWNPEWIKYDFIGAPWPLPTDNYSYQTPAGELVRVGNSVSLRSLKLMKLPTKLNLEWKSYYGNTNEDGFLCVHNRKILEDNGCKFAPLDVAKHFSKEHDIPENIGLQTFAFHSL